MSDTKRSALISTQLRQIAERLRGSKVMRQSCVAALITEEPDDRIGHVRICGDYVHNTHHSMSLKIKGLLS